MYWYRKSAGQGYAPAQNNLGSMYQYGYGVERNYDEAVRLFRLSAEQGSAQGSMSHLGFMYENGKGAAKNLDEARKLYEQAAAQGDE